MHSEISVTFHGIYWRMSCGFCDCGICFDDRAVAIQAARAHAASHDRAAKLDLVVVEDAIEQDAGEPEEWALAWDPELVELDPEPDFHSSPTLAIVIAKRAENPAAFRN